jgi:uncharacterized protein YcgI (DUF1989 family)
MQVNVVPARGGLAVRVAAEQRIRITTPYGDQAADFFAFRADHIDEWLSPMHTWATTRWVRPRQGDTFLSRFRRPMLDFVEDGAGGIHDWMIPACDQARYEQFGITVPHANCSDNLRAAMHRLGYSIAIVPQPINFFTNTQFREGKLVALPAGVPPGSYVDLTAHLDLVCVVSSCPYDLKIPDWEVNAGASSEPTQLQVEINC